MAALREVGAERIGHGIVAEYLLCHTEFGLGPTDPAALARSGARAAFCPVEARSAVLTEIDQLVAAG